MDSFFTIDVEKDIHTGKYLGVTKGIPRLLDILGGLNIKAVFFVTGEVMEKYPEIIKMIAKSGHEVAIHGYSHRRFDLLDSKEKKKEIEMSVNIFRKILREYPKGFRAPQHSIDEETTKLLEENGFKYDSSVCVGNAMLLRHLFKKGTNKKQIILSFFGKKRKYNLTSRFKEIPRASPILALGGFELKVYPSWLISIIISLHRLFRIPINFVMHSWDMIEIKESRTNKLCSAKEFEMKLEKFAEKISKEYNIVKIGDFI